MILDPNVQGDALGMATFEKSMTKVFYHWEQSEGGTETTEEGGSHNHVQQSCRDLLILSHSASGAQLARYLLEKSESYLPHIRAIAFTDATHNVQWARQRGNHQLVNLLESPACVYYRCHHSDDRHAKAGQEAPTDKFWKHRFGNVRTYFAGTSEHSLTNWFAHSFIWAHFDRVLSQCKSSPEMPSASSE